MFRFNRLVCVLAVCVVVAAALGAATKIRWFDNIAEPNPDADGMAILNYVPGQDNIIAQVILSDLEANTQYVVALREPGSWSLVDGDVVMETGFFPISAEHQETDSKGHLTFHSQTTVGSGDYSDSDVLIFVQSDWGPFTELPITIPVRMIGYNGTPAP